MKSLWPTRPLGEVARIRRGASPRPKGDPRYFGGAIPWLKIGDVPPGSRFVSQTKEGVTPAGRDHSVYVDPGTLLLSNSASVGRPVINEVGVCIHDGWLALDRYESCLSRDFLFWFLIQSQARFQQLAQNGTQKNLNISLVSSLDVQVPPLAEQERIVKLLDEADALRKLRAQADRRTAALIPALFHEMFGDQSSFPTATVAEIAEQRAGSIRTGPFGSDLRHAEFVSTGIPVLGIENVVENEFRWTRQRCLTPSKFEEMRRFVVFPNDVLVTIMGTVGRCVITPADLPVCISTKHLCAVSVDRKRIEPRYLWAAFLFDVNVRQQTRAVGKGAIMEGWNSTIIKRLTVAVPPLPLQKEFAARVTEIREMEAAQAAARQRLDHLFQSMLHRAFNGEL